MKKSSYLILGASILSACGVVKQKVELPKPNILWVTIEDTSQQFIGSYGDENARTPVIDHLVGEGVRFTNAFSTNTVCSPSRTAIITWNISLAYMSAQKTLVSVFDSSFSNTITSAKPGAEIGIEITAPLNFDYAKKEHAFVYLNNRLVRVEVEEVGTSSNRFRCTFTVPDNQADPIKVAYGIAWHETYVMVTIE